jgi:hypothetical protein
VISKQNIHRGLSAAYPLRREAIEKLALCEADEELIASIVAEPQESSGATPAVSKGATSPSLSSR